MKASVRTQCLLCISLLALLVSCNRNQKVNEYGYVFQESTGENQYIIMDGRKVPITLIANPSNPVAFKSLRALKWNLLYPNDNGDRIFVRGEYDNQSHSFRLSHWYIKVPFKARVIDDETKLPFTMHEVTRQSLERTDFETKPGFNPNDPAFDPKSFQQAQ